ncbi:hypothetical protein MA16_Dca003530 [Dendrobium catenatum]|uniref:Retrovirus-related Pol polyprotein from transposon TNT 1-94 n=1 Tax=Dendrobium catenatum TaxID=906689 RepID=A0A2I0WF96_9ASPA|nr:hypothetical protein MA16_Dca003530 [Dendrobium catenatum]
MTQYLTDIKSLVDQIASAGSTLDTEGIILYILNGLPAPYKAFKTAIRTMLTPISLHQLYPFLLSEEINIAAETARTTQMADLNLVLYTYRGRGKRNRSINSSYGMSSTHNPVDPPTTCQICLKRGHSASTC